MSEIRDRDEFVLTVNRLMICAMEDIDCGRDEAGPTTLDLVGRIEAHDAALRAQVAALREALRHAARELQHVLDADPCEQREIHQSGEAQACVALAESLLGPMREWAEEPNASMSAALARPGAGR